MAEAKKPKLPLKTEFAEEWLGIAAVVNAEGTPLTDEEVEWLNRAAEVYEQMQPRLPLRLRFRPKR